MEFVLECPVELKQLAKLLKRLTTPMILETTLRTTTC